LTVGGRAAAVAVLEVQAYIEVADLERGIAFYCDGLGLALKRRLGPNWVELDGANLPIFLLGNRPSVAELGGTRAERNFTRHWTPVHLDFIVADLDAVVTRLTGLGASLDRSIQQREYGHMANMADPFGNGFDLIEFSGDGYDAVSR
jgi:predicted enzyme related to lactoylglutathione lyase